MGQYTIAQKAETLRYLIERRAFATSPSSFAREVGYKGKSQIYRLMEGAAGDKQIEEVWLRLCREYELTDEELMRFADVMRHASMLRDVVADAASRRGESEQNLASEMLVALLLHDEDEARCVLSRGEWEVLQDLNHEHPLEYAQVIVNFYVLYLHLERCYKGRICVEGAALTTALYEVMHALQPENQMLTDLCHATLADLCQLDMPGNLWCNTLRPAFMVQGFTDPNYRSSLARMMKLLDVPEESLWMAMDDVSSQEARAYLLLEYVNEGDTGGRYDCAALDAHQSDLKPPVLQSFYFWMMECGDEAETPRAFVQYKDQQGQTRLLHYVYEYRADEHNLLLERLTDEAVDDSPFPAAITLHWIDAQQPCTLSEKRWATWYQQMMEENLDNILLAMMLSDGKVIDESFEIKDVCIGRQHVTVCLSSDGNGSDYRINLTDYPALRRIRPESEVVVMRHMDDGQLYLEWLSPHIAIPLSVQK